MNTIARLAGDFKNGRFTPGASMTSITVSPSDLPLQCLYRWEKERADQAYLTQPMGSGVVQDLSLIHI